MNNKLVSLLVLVGIAIGLSACGGGGSGGSGGGGNDSVYPPPNPAQGTYLYNGESYLYTALPQPSESLIGGVLTQPYPSSYLPNGLTDPYGLQIAYGYDAEPKIAGMTALVTMLNGGAICSATPVKYDESSNTTFLIGAAHCFVANKTNPQALTASNIYGSDTLKVYYGTSFNDAAATYGVKAIYLPTRYCYGAIFSGIGDDLCPNFVPSDGGEGNDIAVIQISGQFGDPVNYPYPRLVESSQYPTPYTMAPVLSIGYGINNQAPNSNAKCGTSDKPCGTMFYVANYQYQTSNSTGYHYLYNSYYNSNSLGSGYTALVCGGDSGGGDLFWTGNDWILLSEHTYGPSEACGTFYNYLPNGATNVSAYYNWIMSILDSSDPITSCRNSTDCVTNAL